MTQGRIYLRGMPGRLDLKKMPLFIKLLTLLSTAVYSRLK